MVQMQQRQIAFVMKFYFNTILNFIKDNQT